MAAIEAQRLNVGYVAIAKSLGLPTQAYMALSDGKFLDAQAGAETMTSAMLAALAGVNSVSGPGMLDFVLTFSLAKLAVRQRGLRAVPQFRARRERARGLAGGRSRGRGAPERSPHHLAAHAQVLAAGAVPHRPDHRPRESRDLDQAGIAGPPGSRRGAGREAARGLCADLDRSRGGRGDAPHDPRGPEGPERAAGPSAAARARTRAKTRRPGVAARGAGRRPPPAASASIADPDERTATGTAGPRGIDRRDARRSPERAPGPGRRRGAARDPHRAGGRNRARHVDVDHHAHARPGHRARRRLPARRRHHPLPRGHRRQPHLRPGRQRRADPALRGRRPRSRPPAAQLLYDLELRRLRQCVARRGRAHAALAERRRIAHGVRPR